MGFSEFRSKFIPKRRFSISKNFTIIVDNLEYDVSLDKSNPNKYNWHSQILGKYTIKVFVEGNEKKFSFKISETPSGCGSVIIHEYNFSSENKYYKIFLPPFEIIMGLIKSDGIGAIITTLGQSFTRDKIYTFLKSSKFNPLKTYKNYRHSEIGDYTQKILLRDLSDINLEELSNTFKIKIND